MAMDEEVLAVVICNLRKWYDVAILYCEVG
jgi:hypothetical protein